MNRKNRNSIASCLKLPQFITMNVIDGQAGLVRYYSLIFYSLTINNILNIIILLILAGVAINALTQTGLFENAKQAKNITENAQKDENKKLGEYSSKINEYISGTSRDEASSEVLKKIEETSTVNTYSYTGSEQEYTVPEDGYYKIECWGAQGGTYQYAVGGKGAYTKGIIKLSKGEKLYVYVGECYNGARETMCYNGGGSGLSGKAIIS